MRKVNLTLLGFVTILIIGLAVVLSQKTLLAQPDAATETAAVKSNSKIPKKIQHKDKKQLKKVFKKGNLKDGGNAGLKEPVKTNKEEKKEIGKGLDTKKDK